MITFFFVLIHGVFEMTNKSKVTKSISMAVDTLMKLKQLEREKHINISKYVEALILESFKGGANNGSK